MANPQLNYEELRVCRCCLATETKLYDVRTNSFISKVFMDLIDKSINTNVIPEYICNICFHRICKFNAFRMQCCEAMHIINNMRLQNQLSTDNIKHIDRTNLTLNLIQTKTESHSYDSESDNAVNKKTKNLKEFYYYNPKDLCHEVCKTEEESSCLEETTHSIEEVLVEVDIHDDCLIKTEICEDNEAEDTNMSIPNNNTAYNLYGVCEGNEAADTNMSIPNNDTAFNLYDDIDHTEVDVKEKKPKSKTAKKRSSTEGKIKNKVEVEQCFETKKKISRRTQKEEGEEVDNNDLMDSNLKNAMLFYNSHPLRKPSKTEVKKRLDLLETFSKTYNVEVKFLNSEEQKQDLEERKKYYGNLPYMCQLCYRGFSVLESYNTHMTVHDPASGDFVCEVCSIRSKTRRDLEKHVNATHQKRFTCKQCGIVTKSQSYAKAHFARHEGTSYTCEQCGKRFTQHSNYLGHVRTSHGDNVDCPICGETFNGSRGLNVHVAMMHKQVKRCVSCSTVFHNEKSLEKHLESAKNNVCDTRANPCPMCGENFESEKVMRKHYDDLHKKEFLKCEQCNKIFMSKQRLSSHTHEHRKSEQVIATGGFMCEVCGKGNFKNRNTLQCHQRLHTGERPYKCAQCHQSFRAHNLLRSHMYVHTDERRYKCPICPKAFHQSAHRTAHLLTHTKERPYVCGACPKRYSSASAAREHRDTQHRGLPPRTRGKPARHTK